MQQNQRIIKAARAFLGLTQSDLAELSGVPTNTIARFEAGANMAAKSYQRIIDSLTDMGVIFITNPSGTLSGITLHLDHEEI